MKNKTLKISLLIVVFVLILSPALIKKIKWAIVKNQAEAAAGGFSYQIGLSAVIVVPCFTIPEPPACAGGKLCYVKDFARCTLYSDVTGTPSGGMGSGALFLNTALAQAGVVAGGQLVAGGMTMTEMDSGVLAGVAGCYNCMAKNENKLIDSLYNIFIAGKKE